MIVAGPQERQLADAAQALLDLCREINKGDPEYVRADEHTLQAGAISLAVQAVWMCDQMTGPRTAGDIQPITAEQAEAKYRGLGLGAGQCIGALQDAGPRTVARETVLEAMARATRKRAAEDPGAQAAADMMRRIFRDPT